MNIDKIPTVRNSEGVPSIEVKLHFNRHYQKGALPEGVLDDAQTPLSPEGMMNAKNDALDEVDLTRSRAIGSPRKRSQHTAAFLMAGAKLEIQGTESLAEIEKRIQEVSNTQAHIREDDRLDFVDDPDSEVGKILAKAYTDKTYLKTIIEKSDAVAKETDDESGANYSAKAADFAGIILDYAKATARFDSATKDKEQTFERFLGTHQGMSECFLAKLIEVTDGVDARNAFVQEVGEMGFDYGEGFDVSIKKVGTDQKIEILYKNRRSGKEMKKDVNQAMLQTIIEAS